MKLSSAIKRLNDVKNLIIFGKDSPLHARRVFIRPGDVAFYTKNRIKGRNCIKSGDWDLAVAPISANLKLEIVRRKIIHNISWEEAGAYEHMQQLMNECGGVADECRSISDIIERYNKLDRLIASLRIDASNYKTRVQLGKSFLREKGGILIHINRDGEPVFGGGGHHRFGICRYLEIPLVPAQLGHVHDSAVKSGVWRMISERKFEI